MSMNVMQGGSEVMLTHDDATVMRTLQISVAQDRNITATVMDKDPEEQVYWRWPPTISKLRLRDDHWLAS